MGEAPTAVGALKDLPTVQSDVVLLDIRLPDLDGLELSRRLKSLSQPPQVLMLTSFGETDNVMAAVGAGADDFVLKTSQDDVLIAASVHKFGEFEPGSHTRHFILTLIHP